LTPKEIDLLHKVWLELSDYLPGDEIHHHDIVHFALYEVQREICNGKKPEVLERLKEHLHEIENRREHP
jgi:transcription antitermination factor NusA-like protein